MDDLHGSPHHSFRYAARGPEAARHLQQELARNDLIAPRARRCLFTTAIATGPDPASATSPSPSVRFCLRLQAPQLKAVGADGFFDAGARKSMWGNRVRRYGADHVPGTESFRQLTTRDVPREGSQLAAYIRLENIKAHWITSLEFAPDRARPRRRASRAVPLQPYGLRRRWLTRSATMHDSAARIPATLWLSTTPRASYQRDRKNTPL